MTAALTSRRKLIVSGFLTWASVWLPSSSLPASDTPGWLAPVMRNLTGMASWMRTEFEKNGDAVIHCGAKDISAWALRAGALAGEAQKVMARGNTLSFRLSENQVRIVMHPDIS